MIQSILATIAGAGLLALGFERYRHHGDRLWISFIGGVMLGAGLKSLIRWLQ